MERQISLIYKTDNELQDLMLENPNTWKIMANSSKIYFHGQYIPAKYKKSE